MKKPYPRNQHCIKSTTLKICASAFIYTQNIIQVEVYSYSMCQTLNICMYVTKNSATMNASLLLCSCITALLVTVLLEFSVVELVELIQSGFQTYLLHSCSVLMACMISSKEKFSTNLGAWQSIRSRSFFISHTLLSVL